MHIVSIVKNMPTRALLEVILRKPEGLTERYFLIKRVVGMFLRTCIL